MPEWAQLLLLFAVFAIAAAFLSFARRYSHIKPRRAADTDAVRDSRRSEGQDSNV